MINAIEAVRESARPLTGAAEAVEIESADTTALVRFRSAVPPELVDGIS